MDFQPNNITILDHFKFLWDGSADDKRFIVMQGGAGSGKSKSLCQRLVYMLLSYADLNIYIVRASMPILKRSVYL